MRISIILATLTTFAFAEKLEVDWKRIPGLLKQITANVDEVWGVNSNMDIYKSPKESPDRWTQVPGKLIWVSSYGFKNNGITWGVNVYNDVFRCNHPCTGNWQHFPGQKLNTISVGHTHVWGTNSQQEVYKCQRPCSRWERVSAPAIKQVSVGEKEVWGVDSNDKIYKCQLPCFDYGQWKSVPGLLKQVGVSIADNTVMGVNKDNTIFRYNNGQWDHTNGALSNVHPQDKHKAYGVNSSDHIFEGKFKNSEMQNINQNWNYIPYPGTMRQSNPNPSQNPHANNLPTFLPDDEWHRQFFTHVQYHFPHIIA